STLVEHLLHGEPGRAVPGAPVHDRPLQELSLTLETVELLVVDEEVVPPVDLPGAGGPGGHRDGEPDLRMVLAHVAGHGPLAHGGGPGQHDETTPAGRRARTGRRVGAQRSPNRSRSWATWLAPSPRT